MLTERVEYTDVGLAFPTQNKAGRLSTDCLVLLCLVENMAKL